MNRAVVLQDYSPNGLVKKINEFIDKNDHYVIVSVTVGPDNAPEHKVGSDIYTAWLDVV